MTDEGDTVTVLQHLLRAGIPEDRAREHLQAGRVHLGGEQVTDPDALTVGYSTVVLRDPSTENR